jgi:PAS domain-containing protein
MLDEEPRIPATAPRQQNLNYDGERTIKKHLGPRDNDSIAESEATTASSTRLANFFGQEVFQIVLHNPTTSHQLTKFCQSRFCGENMDFLEKIDRYNTLIDELGTTMLDIHKNFISVNAPSQLNLSDSVLLKMNKDLKVTLGSALPKMENLFTSAQHNTEDLVFSDIYPRFVRHQLVVSATKALATDRSKYAGLGDCFVLTNPAKADNPIVFASDGFVNVTGYTRRDIIPRNCRFLQGRYTDREAVTRLKMSIDNREESVELLLNYKKNKEPFWNLLYTAPLYDENGNVAFFIGGQINCSTTIHSASDILRLLSYSEDVDDQQEKPAPAPVKKSTFGKSFFRSLRGDSIAEINGNKEVGMENALLNKIEKLTVKKQMETFHSAYSKVRFRLSVLLACLFPHSSKDV